MSPMTVIFGLLHLASHWSFRQKDRSPTIVKAVPPLYQQCVFTAVYMLILYSSLTEVLKNWKIVTVFDDILSRDRVTIDRFCIEWLGLLLHSNTARDHTLHITVPHRPVFSVTLLGNGGRSSSSDLTSSQAGDHLTPTSLLTADSGLCRLTAKLLLALASTVILGSESHGTHEHILVSGGSGCLQHSAHSKADSFIKLRRGPHRKMFCGFSIATTWLVWAIG
jgi:hypothetical protein